MHLNRAVFAGFSAMMLVAAPAAIAQTSADREMYEPMFDAALEQLNRKNEQIAESEAELGQATDLVQGCALLEQNVGHLSDADELLTEMHGYADRLRRRDQREAIEAQQAAVQEALEMRQGDIERMCQDLPED